jgi:mono/diheme cytochrome c family protein
MPLRHRPPAIPIAALLIVAWGCVATHGGESSPYARLNAALVAEGRRIWSTSLDPSTPVSCATCHFDPLAIREWAASFPKVRPEPPPHSRVVTLLQANASAIRLHYRIEEPLREATAITAFLRAIGGSVPVSPGVAQGQPLIPSRLDRLRASARRGEDLVAGRCGRCHTTDKLAQLAARFPRGSPDAPESFEAFVGKHAELAWDGPEMADLSAQLFARLAGTSLDSPLREEDDHEP